MTRNEQWQKLVEEYRQAGKPWPAMLHDIAVWAWKTGKWTPSNEVLVQRATEELRTALREEYIQDPRGRSERAKHAAMILKNGKQMMFWDDIRTASPDHMKRAFALRRKQIVGDCRQLQLDVGYYNVTRNPAQPIQMSFNFDTDLLELELQQGDVAA